MITMKQLARAAGVSQTTVSHALNGKGRVSDETRERIVKISRELGFKANATAVGLRTGSSRLIALQIASDMIEVTLPNSAYFTELLNGASQAAMETGWLVAVVPTLINVEHLAHLQIDCGIVVDPTGTETLLQFLNDRSGIAVTTGRVPDNLAKRLKSLSLVHVDNDMRELTFCGLDHLLAAGYRRPALLTLNSEKSYVTDIVAAYETWCVSGGHEVIVGRASNLNEPEAARAAERLLGHAPSPDAVFTTNEAAAHGVIKAAQRLGMTIPDDLGLISTMPTSRIMQTLPSMTALNPNAYEIGRTAVRVLLEKVTVGSRNTFVERVPFSLRPGASTARFMITRNHQGSGAAKSRRSGNRN